MAEKTINIAITDVAHRNGYVRDVVFYITNLPGLDPIAFDDLRRALDSRLPSGMMPDVLTPSSIMRTLPTSIPASTIMTIIKDTLSTFYLAHAADAGGVLSDVVKINE